ncbi:MAG: hypothetical protein F2737_04395 [Actinobacteria bacterium]|uniref:Unannotated protein n=1 Tax=freshwater metagenome TaxID=449393 RepID=A0A6J6XU11_9ZZZZ|nr:hypothetical protein [Actinomycetota bacterium]
MPAPSDPSRPERLVDTLFNPAAEQVPNVDVALAGIVGCFAPFAGSANT